MGRQRAEGREQDPFTYREGRAMAEPNVTEIATSTMEARSSEVADNISDNNAILIKLKDNAEEPVDGGRVIYEEIYFTENVNGQWYSGTEALSTAHAPIMSAAEFAWKQYAIAVVMSGLEELQNSGEAAVFNLLAKRIKGAEFTMKNAICASLYSDGTGHGGKELTGFGLAVPQDPTTGTYGSISRVSSTFWRSQLNDPGSTPTTSTIGAEMLELWVACTRGSDHPNLIMSGGTIYQTYVSSLTPNQRFTDPKMADLGFTNVKFMNAPVVLDGGIGGNLTATDMLFLNTKFVHWRPHAKRNFVPIGKKRMAVNQDAAIEYLGFAGNLTLDGPQFCGRLKGD